MFKRLFFATSCVCVISVLLLGLDQKKSVHSFDVFDTLIGRLHKTPISVFELVEQRYPFPGFTSFRISAENGSDGSLDDIYRRLAKSANLSEEEAQKLRAFEFETEMSNIFPIMNTMSKVQDGDILVSDTYYNADEILKLVQHTGLDKKVRVYATYGGKARGWIWPQILQEYSILLHVGDNQNSDVISPKRYGIPSLLIDAKEFSKIEQHVYQAGHQELANLMRVLRLSNPYPENSQDFLVWDEQAQLNVPILINASLYLDTFCKTNHKDKILFSSRGCCHWITIFKKLFPQYQSIYFHASRHCYRNPSPEYIQYVSSLYTSKTVIVDEHGTGWSSMPFLKKYISKQPCYLILVRRNGSQPCVLQSRVYANIELLNQSTEGTLITFTKNGPVRQPVEYDPLIVQPAFECIHKCVNLLDQYAMTKYDPEVMTYTLDILKSMTPAMSKYFLATHNVQK